MGGRATLTGIGRSLRGSNPKHLIKAADRLLGNVRLHGELLLFYAAVCRRVIPTEGRPLLLIDWTDIGKLWAVLTVTLVSKGRGVVIYSRAYPRRRENDPRAEAECLRTLELLMGRAKPIIVSDAGFRGPWMTTVRGFVGWDFVGRVRGRVQIRLGEMQKWRKVKSLWSDASLKPNSVGLCELVRSKPVAARLVLVRQRVAGRKRLPKIGRRKKRHIRSAREPWVLATSMLHASAKEIVAIYETRMRIEETFRDQKCPRFGWGLDEARTKSVDRINVLLMLAALAHYAAMLIGAAAEAMDFHLRFQANTVKSRRVLSLVRLARAVLSSLLIPDWKRLLINALPAGLGVAAYE